MLEDRCVKNLEWCWQGSSSHAMNNALFFKMSLASLK